MIRSVVLFTAFLLAGSFGGGGAAAGPDDVRPRVFLCAYPPPLLPTRLVSGFEPVDAKGPGLRVRRLRGEHQGIALALENGATRQRLRVHVRGEGGARGICATVGVVTFVDRSSPYVGVLASRQGAGRRTRQWPQADAIVPDEERWTSMGWTRGTRATDVCGSEAVTAVLEPGALRYLWIDLIVPPTAKPGTHTVRVTVEGETSGKASAVGFDLEVEVLEDVLPAHDKIVMISNEMDDDVTVRWLTDLGCTGLRSRDVTQRTDVRETLAAWADLGIRVVIQHRPPRSKAEVERLPSAPDVYFYGRDEPQPKRSQGRAGWEEMAEHVRRSQAIRALGGRVVTSLPYVLAVELAERGSDVYDHLEPFGLDKAFEPLDFANCGAGVHRLDRLVQEENGLYGYVAKLRKERRRGQLDGRGRPRSKHDRLETFYAPHGMMRDPFFGRLLFGFFLATCELDGTFAWTLFRPRGSPVDDSDGPDATLAYPAVDGVISTWTAEGLRAGLNDLRLVAWARARRSPTAVARILRPFENLVVEGRRIDVVVGDEALHEARERLLDLGGDSR